MKYFNITFILFLIWQASFAQDADTSTIATFKIRKPEVKKPAGAVFTTGESRSFVKVRNNRGPSYDYVLNSTGTSIKLLDLEYPQAAIDSAISGVVVVNYELDEIGSPANIAIMEAAHWLLNGAAVNYVRSLPAKSPEVFREVQKELRRGRITVFILPVTFFLE